MSTYLRLPLGGLLSQPVSRKGQGLPMLGHQGIRLQVLLSILVEHIAGSLAGQQSRYLMVCFDSML